MSEDEDKAAAEAERIQKRRTRMLQASGLLFVVWMSAAVAGSTNITPGAMRGVDIVRNLAMLAWGAGLLTLLVTGGLTRRDQRVREILEDELTKAHRRNALMSGFWVMLIAVAVIYAVSLFTPIAFNQVAPILLVAAVAVPALRFALLERRASRDA